MCDDNTWVYLQKRELLEFCVVFAFPKASNIDPEFRTFRFTKSVDSAVLQRKSIRFEEVLVFPAPVIPDIMNDWFLEHLTQFTASFAEKYGIMNILFVAFVMK